MNDTKTAMLIKFAQKNGFPLSRTRVSAEEAVHGETINPGYEIDTEAGAPVYYKLSLSAAESDEGDLMKIAILNIEKSTLTIRKCIAFLTVVVALGLTASLLVSLML